MIGNNDGARTIILQYGGIFVREGLFMPMIVNGKAPEGYEAFEGDDVGRCD